MLTLPEEEQRLLAIVRRDPRYAIQAYDFVRDSVTYACHVVYATGTHVRGQELLEAIRRLALERYGALTRDVFESWGVTRTEDFGEIVFRLVEEGILAKTEDDSMDDFRDGFRFEEAFRNADYWQELIGESA
ncbi:MAG: hypothetical protein KC591_06515 [Gemmatimonadetes bacterium]|nr:hypothetical protein [Gemmatimonadota bacterium]